MLILMTHGNFAEGILHSARMIIGETVQRTYTICVQPEMDQEMVIQKFREVTSELQEGEPLYVMVDILSGTPCNVALRMINEYEDYTIISGLNLGMLLEFIMDESFMEKQERIQAAMDEGKRQVQNVSETFRERMAKK